MLDEAALRSLVQPIFIVFLVPRADGHYHFEEQAAFGWQELGKFSKVFGARPLVRHSRTLKLSLDLLEGNYSVSLL